MSIPPPTPDVPAPADHTISVVAANVIGALAFVAAGVLVVGAFRALWALPVMETLDAFLGRGTWELVAVLVPSVVAHELLHGVGFRAAGVPWRTIRFGVHWRALTPYASTRAPMSARGYRRAVALPGLVLGAAPAAAGLLLGSPWLATYGAIMLGGAGGDALVLWAIRGVPGSALVRDSATRVGCEVLAAGDGATPG